MRATLALIFTLFSWVTASAEVPHMLHYNGYLVNGAGEAVDCPDAVQCATIFDLTFRLYEGAEQGGVLWEETHSSVPFYDGSFHVVIGTINPITGGIVNGPTWLGIKVNDNTEMSPRQRLVSSAYALHAESAVSSNEADNATHLGGIAADEFEPGPKFSGSFYDLTDVPVDLLDGDNDTLGALICAPGMVAKVTGAGWACDNDATGGVDTTLSEEEVDAMVANNNYATGAHTTDTTLSEAQVDEMVANNNYAIGAHTIDTTLSEAQVDEMVANNGYAVQTDLNEVAANLSALDSSLAPVAKNGLPVDLADGDDDALGGLLCAIGEIASWNGASWICSARTQGDCVPGQVVQSVNADGSVSCSDANISLGSGAPAACTPSERGEIYISEIEGVAHLCDGAKFHRIKLCGGTCDASAVTCGGAVLDDCGFSCGVTGTALDTGSCADAASLTCGATATDACSNSCAYTGTLCPEGSNCASGVCENIPSTATYDTLNFNGMSFYALNLDECHPGGGNCCGGSTTQQQMDAFCVLAGHTTAIDWTLEALTSTSCYCNCGTSWSSPCCSGSAIRMFVTSVTCE